MPERRPRTHQCYECGGQRYFGKDHRKGRRTGGWESCKGGRPDTQGWNATTASIWVPLGNTTRKGRAIGKSPAAAWRMALGAQPPALTGARVGSSP